MVLMNIIISYKAYFKYDKQLVRMMVEKITIYDGKFVIGVKSGTGLDVRH